ncbi:tRNA (adenosine(37)-N6)-dimethylallyltransferase MiaA [Nocardia sp. NPDC051832]|uniref:tRNA (adenosine(37)-N6)-dimethylallyltransferase MiaA n=1 Tax=Nocardia sp. NPDC051832 TaxID=3155673 RepID=UPI00344A0D34
MTAGITPIAVVGPTATGKSDLGLELAERFGGEIVNIDAMQLYRGMDIGTAKLPVAQRRGIPHHQLDVLDVTEYATVAAYQTAAIADVESIMARGHVPVIVGGSMMYVQALLDNWEFPATDPVVRARWEAVLAERGVAAVHAELTKSDPAAAATILPTDGRRMVRALEVVELTGKPFAASAPTIGEPRWGTTIIGVDRDTAELDARIELRTALMFDAGLVEEVQALIGKGLRDGVTARRAIGYAQVLAYLDDEYDLAQARERTLIGTRRYVRRQRSWFRRDPRVRWVNGADPDLVATALGLLESSSATTSLAGSGPQAADRPEATERTAQ